VQALISISSTYLCAAFSPNDKKPAFKKAISQNIFIQNLHWLPCLRSCNLLATLRFLPFAFCQRLMKLKPSHWWQQLGADDKDKTRVQMLAEMFPHLKLLCLLFMGPTLGLDTKQRNSVLIKFGVFFTIITRF
jgi:hypothetical protein